MDVDDLRFEEEEDSGSDVEESDSDEESEEESDEEDAQGIAEHHVPLNLETQGEMEIESDFARLVADLRGVDAQGAAGKLSKVWDINIEDQEAAFKDDLRAASGVGARKRKGRKRGRRPGVVLSPQVRALVGEGNQAFVDNNVPEAIRLMQEVIRIEPRASSAWSVLAQCYEDMGDKKKALQSRIMAAHLLGEAEDWDELARQSRALGYSQQALYCYRKIYSIDPTNVDALWDRATLAQEVGDSRAARHSLLAILKVIPHELNVLRELRALLIESSEFALCASLFAGALDHHQTLYPSGPVSTPDAEAFGLMDILVLVDLYNTPTLAQYEDAVRAIKRGVRWLQGRAAQRYWEVCEDDREYDVEGSLLEREGEPRPGMHALDTNARHRLAVARLKMGDLQEGKMHADVVLSGDIIDYAPLFAEIADVYFDREMYTDACPIYELLGTDAATSSMYVLLQAAACRRMMGDLQEAAEIYEHAISADPKNNDAKLKLAEIYEIMNEPRKALVLVYQVIDTRRQRHGNASREGPGEGPADAGSLFEEGSTVQKAKKTKKTQTVRMTNTELKAIEDQKEKETSQSFQRLEELWPALKAWLGGEGGAASGDGQQVEREWLLEAGRMVDNFRETRQLFGTNRYLGFRGMWHKTGRGSVPSEPQAEENEDNLASRLELDLSLNLLQPKAKTGKPVDLNTFRGIGFDDWLRVFMQYAFILTLRDQYALGKEILEHTFQSVAYQKRQDQDTIRLSLMTIAVAARDAGSVMEHGRKTITSHQFNNEAVRLLLASLPAGLSSIDTFIDNTFQKQFFREVKLQDAAVKSKESLSWYTRNRRYVLKKGAKAGDEEGADDPGDGEGAEAGEEDSPSTDDVRPLPTKLNPVGVAVYGQLCGAARSYQSALFYLLHAVDYAVDDPVVCLSMANASLGRAMQRQADNRHHLVAQALAFLSKYRELRAKDAEDEVEFNFGRAFHQLGLHSLAVRHYEKVLDLAEHKMDTPDADVGVAREAAYNLSLIYITTGAKPLARAIVKKWLSI